MPVQSENRGHTVKTVSWFADLYTEDETKNLVFSPNFHENFCRNHFCVFTRNYCEIRKKSNTPPKTKIIPLANIFPKAKIDAKLLAINLKKINNIIAETCKE